MHAFMASSPPLPLYILPYPPSRPSRWSVVAVAVTAPLTSPTLTSPFLPTPPPPLSSPSPPLPCQALPGGAERLKLFPADLLEVGSFDAAFAGCDYVVHCASPYT